MNEDQPLISSVREKYGDNLLICSQATADNTLTIWVISENCCDILRFLKNEISKPFRMLYDLTAIDERRKSEKRGNLKVILQLFTI